MHASTTTLMSDIGFSRLSRTVASNFSGFQGISTLFPQFSPLSPNPTKMAKFLSGLQIAPKFPKEFFS
jgi:hypothetical protein